MQEHHSSKNYEKIKLAEQTLVEVKAEYEKAIQEIQSWLSTSPLAPKYKKACTEYYIIAHTQKYMKATYGINNMERELKRCLGEE